MVDRELDDCFDKVPMTEARSRLPELTTTVATGKQQAVELYRRDAPAALLVSHSRFAAFVWSLSGRQSAERRRKRQLAWLITEQWLGGAPAHLREPQIAELEGLSLESLFALFVANPARLAPTDLVRKGVNARTVERLKKRRRVARAIKEAEDDDLYEVAEHATSEVDLDDGDDADD